MDETPFYKAMLFWQKNATESLQIHCAKVISVPPGSGLIQPTDDQKQFQYAINNVEILDKARLLMREQYYSDHGPNAKPEK